jgi:hypothetical protein
LAGQAASENSAYSAPTPRPTRPAYRPVRKKALTAMCELGHL